MAYLNGCIPMSEVAVHMLKNSLSAVLEKVQAGEEAIITSHRKPIAKIVALNAPLRMGALPKAAKAAPNMPAIAGVTWRTGRFKPQDFAPIALKGTGPSVADMLVAQRRGQNTAGGA
jgi:prevent-host-death family protein